MTQQSPIELALAAHGRPRDPDDTRSSQQIADAKALAATGLFSIQNIVDITGLPRYYAYSLIEKHDKSGGRLNPETLSIIYDLWYERQHRQPIDRGKVKLVVGQGTSQHMLAKLTGIPQASISGWLVA